MGTTASTAQQTVATATFENVHGNGTMEDRTSLSIHSFQTVGLHNNKAKSIITNKVAPVVITYNCKEEFQIHDDLLKASYTVGRITESTPEHYLVQGKYFMVRDVYSKLDVLNTTSTCGAPNFRQAKGGYSVFGMGQPSFSGFKQVLQKLQNDGHKVCTWTSVIQMHLFESPNLLLLQDPSRPPPALLFSCQTGVGRTNLAMVLGILVLYHHKGGLQKLDLPQSTKFLPRDRFRVIQNFIGTVPKGQQIVEEVDAAISLCSEMHDLKEAIYECKKKLEGIGDDYQIQGNSAKEYFLQRTLQSLGRYFCLVAFNYYLHEQYPLAFALSFSRWMCRHPELYRLQASTNLSELTITGEQLTKGARVLVVDERFSPDVLSTVKEMSVANFRRVPKMPVYGMAQPNSKAIGSVLSYLTDAKRKYSHILWVNLREEVVLEGNEQIYTLREPGNLEQQIAVPVTSPEQLEKLESVLKNDLLKSQKWIEVYLEQEKQMKMFKTCLTMQEVFNQHKSSCQGLAYKRIPIPDFCAPKEKDFDQLLEAMKNALAEDSNTAFVFNCHSGRGRTTTAMVIAVLTLWHFNVCTLLEGVIHSAKGLKLSKERVVMKVVQLLPEGHQMKKQVDMALDIVSETMTPMHYHLREIIICSYRQGKTAKEEKDLQTLQLRSLQYLERYIYLILFNAYMHLEKKDSWQRPFSTWMHEVAARAGVYEILNCLGFAEFEDLEDKPLTRLRYRWQEQNRSSSLFQGEFI
uniref:Paladin n=1 Tax=Varanus komodoensis TaxID=61221 RepID=A0A8D2J8C7_VARKO